MREAFSFLTHISAINRSFEQIIYLNFNDSIVSTLPPDHPFQMQPFYPIIRVIANAYEIPQLGRKRRIAALLPYDYFESNKSYPVLYLNDGQNLFNEDAPFGNWRIDGSLQDLAEKGFKDIIIIAIDHGGKQRISEYSPYPNEKFKKVEGELYLDFIVNTLKPYVDRSFRVKQDRENTGIGGSSMGGLISLYAGIKYSHIFSKLMIFSPSLWVSPQLFADSSNLRLEGNSMLYIYAGRKESKSHITNVLTLYKAIKQNEALLSKLEMEISINSEGTHSEVHWKHEFPIALKWLYFNNEE